MKNTTYVVFVALLTCHGSLYSQESTESDVAPNNDAFTESRREAQQIQVLVNEKPVKLRSTPLYTYDDNVRNWNKGTTWIWGEEGRPDVVLNLSTNGQTRCIELISFSSEPIEVTASEGEKWQPEQKWDPTPLIDAPKPAASRSMRLIQMRRLARRFSAEQSDHIEGSYELRLLPQPIYRYENESKSSLDGAFFAFVRESDLEIILVIDAVKSDTGQSQWNFACRTVALCKQDVQLDDRRVWGHAGRSPDPSQYQLFRRAVNSRE